MQRITGIVMILAAVVFLVSSAVYAADLPPVIKLGGQGVTSGAHADYGRQMIMGATLAIDEINAAGGGTGE